MAEASPPRSSHSNPYLHPLRDHHPPSSTIASTTPPSSVPLASVASPLVDLVSSLQGIKTALNRKIVLDLQHGSTDEASSLDWGWLAVVVPLGELLLLLWGPCLGFVQLRVAGVLRAPVGLDAFCGCLEWVFFAFSGCLLFSGGGWFDGLGVSSWLLVGNPYLPICTASLSIWRIKNMPKIFRDNSFVKTRVKIHISQPLLNSLTCVLVSKANNSAKISFFYEKINRIILFCGVDRIPVVASSGESRKKI